MTVPKHPMSALKGTKEAKDLMSAVRAHKKPVDERDVAARFIANRSK